MRFLFFADLHLDSPFVWLGQGNGLAHQRRASLRQALTSITSLAATEHVDGVWCAGDLFDNDRIAPDTLRFVQEQFGSIAPIPVTLAPGNHDWLGPLSAYNDPSWPSNVKVFTEDRLAPRQIVDGITLWGSAFHGPTRTRGFLDGFRVDRSGVNLGLFHASLQGGFPMEEGKSPYAPFTDQEVAESGLDHAFVGHFHRPSLGTRHTYPGNPEPLSLGETGERGAVLVEVHEDGRIDRSLRPVSTTPFSELSFDVTGCSHSQAIVDGVRELASSYRGLIRITLMGDLDPDVDLHLGDFDRLSSEERYISVRLGKLTPALDLAEIMSQPTVQGQFVRDVLSSDEMNEATKRLVLTAGLRALQGSGNLEVM